jgi:hypothetical protein
MADAPLNGKQIILRALRNAITGIVVATVLAYGLDFVILRARTNPTGRVTVRPVYEVPQKNKSTEYMIGDPQDQICAHSLFPQMGHSPCWYLQGHREQHISM